MWSFVSAQKPPVPLPSEFEVGVHTFFDFGPPTDFYQLYVVRNYGRGSRVERITLTPEGIKCLMPPKIELANANLDESIVDLMGKKNPCAIPEKDLRREKKRCKNCEAFSGANVTMKVECGSATRLIRADILDKDMFSANARTPENTAWTMDLLSKLDKAAGPGVMDKPMFDLSALTPAESMPESAVMEALAAGSYDALFSTGPIKASELFRQARGAALPHPTVTLSEPLEIAAKTFAEPVYPPIARMARVQGQVTFAFEIDSQGNPEEVTIIAGHPLLQQVVKETITKWRFLGTEAGRKLQGTFVFSLNCPELEESQ